jgi:hypothetical protein
VSTHSIPPLIALTHDASTKVDPAELATVGAALQKQVTRDFAPAWGQQATIAVFPGGVEPPTGYWTIVVTHKVDAGDDYGYHNRSHYEPHALVRHTRGWPMTASHELLEMLADPWGSRLVAADDPRGRTGRVRVLVEACDPCQNFGYKVDGIKLSDFVLPSYYGPHRWLETGKPPSGAERYSFTGAVDAPLSLARGGYLSFVDAKDQWWSYHWYGARRSSVKLGRIEGARTPRAWIDFRQGRER